MRALALLLLGQQVFISSDSARLAGAHSRSRRALDTRTGRDLATRSETSRRLYDDAMSIFIQRGGVGEQDDLVAPHACASLRTTHGHARWGRSARWAARTDGGQPMAPAVASRSISSPLIPYSVRIVRECSPAAAARRWRSPGVRDRRGAGAGSSLPLPVAMRAARAVVRVLGASPSARIGATHASVPSKTALHSSRVFVRKISAKRAAVFGHAARSNWCGMVCGVDPEALEEPRVELRLDRADRHVLAVRGLVGVVERRAGVEQVRAALVAPQAAVARTRRGRCARYAAPSTIAASITCPLPERARSKSASTMPERAQHAAAGEIAEQVDGRQRPLALAAEAARARPERAM